MGDQTQPYDIFQTPLSSGYPLPLTDKKAGTDGFFAISCWKPDKVKITNAAHLGGCSVAQLGCSAAQVGCSVAQLGCSAAQLGCSVGQLGCSVA
jgi:hypothetical protein